jgi:glycosyltransferase involved in cell wall biosynthesis
MHVALLQDYFLPHAPGGAEWSTLALARRLIKRGVQATIVTTDLAGDDTREETARLDRELAAEGLRVVRLPFPKKMHGPPRVFASYVYGNVFAERYLARRLVACDVEPDLYHVQNFGMLVPALRAARCLGRPVLMTVRDYRGLCPVAVCVHRDDLPPAACSHAQYRQCTREYLELYTPALPLAARLRYHLRRELEWWTRSRQQRALRDLDATVFVSDATRMIYAAAKLAGQHPVVIHNPPPDAEATADAAPLRERFGLTGPLVLFVGRWSLGKGAEEMSAAWPLIRQAHPTAQLVVVGRRESELAPQPADGVVFTGPLDHAATLGLLHAARVVALPSRWPEPYSRVALEAMAAAKPLVATKAGGNPELVQDDVNGYLAPRRDPAAFAAQVNKLLANPDLARRMGEAGERRLHHELSGDQLLDAQIALYERLQKQTSRLRICAPATSLSDRTNLGGGVYHAKSLQALADRGVQCLIPLVYRPAHEPRTNWDVRVLPLRRAFKLGPAPPNVVFFFALLWLRWVRGERFDLVRIGDPYHFGPGALLAARLLGVPAVGVIFHLDDDRRFENAVIGWTARRLDGVLAISRATAAEITRRFRAPEERLHLVGCGATPPGETSATAAEAKRAFGLADAPVIGFLNRLEPRKNVGLLLEAFALLAPQHPDAQLLIAGDGPQRDKLAEQARALGVAERVVFVGWLDPDRKAIALRAMDVFAFPSLMEGFGMAVAEAMLAGVPVVVSDRGSLPEVVRDGETGLVAPIASPRPLADALDRLLRDAALRARLGEAGRRDAAARFTWERCAEQTEIAFRAVLAERGKQRLGVLLNSGDSLATMKREGQESRFVDHYLRRYAAAFDEVEVFSYGDDRERPLPRVEFVPGRPRWPGPFYAALMPLLHESRFRRLALLRVMQTGAALPAVVARLLFGARFVTTYGYNYGDFMRVRGRRLYGWHLDRLERVALRLADRVIVTTPTLREHVRGIVADEKIVLLPNGVDLSAFQPTPRLPRAGKATALFVGRLTAQKNLPLALEALAPLRDRVRLVCVGEGEQAAALRAQADALGVELELTGVVPHEQLPALHARADLFVLPSRVEGHPKALLEAMASGLPCVGARAPGIVDVIVDGENGLLAESDDASFRAAIERVLDDPALATRLGENARRTAVEQYDLDRLLTREIELLAASARRSRRCRGC